MMSETIELVGLTKRFGDVVAVDDVTLTVQPGELLTLLGPSGCGKTTLLRLLSGFERPTRGSIRIGGSDVTALPPHRRDINQVFQSYALFPHLTVRENIAFGLKMRRCPSDEIAKRVAAVIALVSLEGMEARFAHELSGGQRQRVALARAIVPEPRILLLDEPLSALDAKLRREMQVEIKRLQRKLGLTTILVTHDQEEALALSDRVAVMRAGRVEQLGTGDQVYHLPRTAYVADFLGESNLLRAKVVEVKDLDVVLETEDGWKVTARMDAPPSLHHGELRTISMRPEKIRIVRLFSETENALRGRVIERTFLGATARLVVETDTKLRLTLFVSDGDSSSGVALGDAVACVCEPGDVVLLDS
jgi:spermidine/putrescine transport system ATP-binding protein